VIEPLLLVGRIATCGIIDLELLYRAPRKKTYQQPSTPSSPSPADSAERPRHHAAQHCRAPARWGHPCASVMGPGSRDFNVGGVMFAVGVSDASPPRTTRRSGVMIDAHSMLDAITA
jgi:hypothetical protein